jgi:hypothetical protein
VNIYHIAVVLAIDADKFLKIFIAAYQILFLKVLIFATNVLFLCGEKNYFLCASRMVRSWSQLRLLDVDDNEAAIELLVSPPAAVPADTATA